MSIYAALNRIRLCASEAVLAQAQKIVTFIVEQYFAPNVSVDELLQRVHDKGADPLKAFSEACRSELMLMDAPGWRIAANASFAHWQKLVRGRAEFSFSRNDPDRDEFGLRR